MFKWTKEHLPLLAILAFSFSFSYFCGQRGIFAKDQSIAFDGGFRIAMGQTPFVDFVFPHGLLSFYFHAFTFQLFGVSYQSFVLTGALANILVALVAYHIVRALAPEAKEIALWTAAVLSVWIFSPFTGLYPEPLAALFFLSSFSLLVRSCRPRLPVYRAFPMLSCLSLSLSFFAKQNIFLISSGIYFTSLLVFVFCGVVGWSFFFGSLALVLLFIGLGIAICFAFYEADLFYYYFFEIPSLQGKRRFLNLLDDVLTSLNSTLVVISLAIALLCLVSWRKLKLREKLSSNLRWLSENRSQLIPILLACVIMFAGPLSRPFIRNMPLIAYWYVGLVVAFLFIGVVQLSSRSLHSMRYISRTIFLFLFLVGALCSYYRTAQEAVRFARYDETLPVKSLDALRWATPTYVTNDPPKLEVQAKDIRGLLHYLQNSKKEFFVFPYSNYLHGALGQDSPSPLLWYLVNLTYRRDDIRNEGQWIAERLEAKGIEIIVLEAPTHPEVIKIFNDFPDLMKFIEENFSLKRNFGQFSVYQQN